MSLHKEINFETENLFLSGKLTRIATVSKMEIVRTEGGHDVARGSNTRLKRPPKLGGCLRSRLGVLLFAWVSTRKDLHPICEGGFCDCAQNDGGGAVHHLTISVSLAKRGPPPSPAVPPPSVRGAFC